jgi:hypothetical protein
MTELLEIETTTTVRAALAEKLVKCAAKRKTTPVELMADIVVNGITALDKPPSAPIINLSAEAEVRKLREELAQLREQYRDARARSLDAGTEVTTIAREAKRREMTVERLMRTLIETIAQDDLFAAILDQ